MKKKLDNHQKGAIAVMILMLIRLGHLIIFGGW